MSYTLYVRPYLNYGDVIYHNQRADMMNCIEQLQYKACLMFQVVGRVLTVKNYTKNLGGNPCLKDDGSIV